MVWLSRLEVTTKGKDEWQLIAPLRYKYKYLKPIEVPIGFISDLASVPKVAQQLFPSHGRYSEAAVLHDYLYVTQKLHGAPISRSKADKIFLSAMKDSGVKWFRAYPIYAAVRLGGWLVFNSHRE